MTTDSAARPTTVDGFLGGRLMLEQPTHGYRAGLDAILLAAACPIRGDVPCRVIDCGAGVGAAGLAVAVRWSQAAVVLVERDPATVALARSNIVRNGLAQRARAIEADLTAPLSRTPDLAALAGSFDQVIANPPYFADGAGTRARDDQRQGAHSMSEGELAQWLRFAAAMARNGGVLTLIHRSEALGDVLSALEGRFGGARILPIQATAADRARRVLVTAVKGSRAPIVLLPALIVHGADGQKYSNAIEAIVRRGDALLWPAA